MGDEEKHAGGRPRNYTDKEVSILVNALEEYIEKTDIPILVEFAYINDISRDDLYNYKEFCALRKKAIDKKEAQLERKGLNNEIDKTLAIFSLKQLGWSDKKELEHSGSVEYKIKPPPTPEEAYPDDED
jgi:hypothetical protein